jgi:C-terminal processing protease CtpA/Prc
MSRLTFPVQTFGSWCLLSLWLAPLAFCQAQDSARLAADQLPYYQMQAFHADSATDRIPLNHIGVEIQATAAGYLVTAVLEGYPAHLAGLNRGDIIQTVDGMAYQPIYSFNGASIGSGDFIENRASHEIKWQRDDTNFTATLRPVFENLYDSYRSATLNSIQEFPSGNKLIGYVRLWGFSRSSNDLISFQRLMQEFEDCDGLILDLRNSYGFLTTQHLDRFFRTRSRFFESAGQLGEQVNLSPMAIPKSADYYQHPVAVLVNSETRGGAELFAYQLAKLDRVVTLGQVSAGMLGDYINVPDSTPRALQYMPAAETLIDGEVFEAVGVEPSQIVEYPYTQSGRGDLQYETAVLVLLGLI